MFKQHQAAWAQQVLQIHKGNTGVNSMRDAHSKYLLEDDEPLVCWK